MLVITRLNRRENEDYSKQTNQKALGSCVQRLFTDALRRLFKSV